MQRTGTVRRTIAAAILTWLLITQASTAVTTVSSQEYVSIWAASRDPFAFLFTENEYGPDLGSFQASVADAGVDPLGVSVAAQASQDFVPTINVAEGTILGTFSGTALASLSSHSAEGPEYRATSLMGLVFSVPQGQQAVYRFAGTIQYSDAYSYPTIQVRLRDWIPEHGEPGNTTFASAWLPGGFDLNGVLGSGMYSLYASADAWDALPDSGGSISLDFSIVPEPATVLLLVLSLPAGRALRGKR